MFRGKLITAYPNDDDATLFAFQTIVKKYGWKYMDDYMATEPKFIQGHLGVVRSVAAGESLATFDMMLHHTMVEKSEGKPIDVAFPATDAIPIWGQLGAIFKDAPIPTPPDSICNGIWREGTAGADWHLVGAQRRSATVRLKPILDYNVANDLAELVTDPAQLSALRKRSNPISEEVKNKGGIR